jgi:peptidyl-dipeptidase A
MKPDYEWAGVLLHELGHGVYYYYNDRQKPWLLRNEAHIFAGESIAYFFHRLAGNPEWLEQVVGISKDDVAAMSEKCRRMNRTEKLVFSRFVQVMTRFERALYENPDRNLNKLWWDLVEKYQGVSCPEGRDEPDWASKIHIAVEPVYYHNYLIADLLTCQFVETVGRKVLNSSDPFNSGFAGNPEIGKFFVDNVFHPGMLYPWNEMIRRATGEKLTSVYYARMINEMK